MRIPIKESSDTLKGLCGEEGVLDTVQVCIMLSTALRIMAFRYLRELPT